MPRRRFGGLAAAAAAVLSIGMAPARAADVDVWPSRPLTLLVPYAPGGNVDVMARWVAPDLAQRLGRPVVIENLAGAGGVIGTEKAVRARPDGYTLLMSVESAVVIAKMVTPATVRFDGLKDLVPVTLLGAQPLALVGKPDLTPGNAAELYRDMKAHPRRYSYASSGVGTSLHLGGEWLKQMGGVEMLHVPYRSGGQILSDLGGNQLDLAVLPLSMVMQQARAGKLRIFGVMDKKPSPVMPEVPALGSAEPAWKGVEVTVWQGIFVPRGTSPSIVARLDKALREVLTLPSVRRNFEEGGVVPLGLGPAQFGSFLQAEQAKFGQIVATGQIRAE
ncbi:tripartite tricarboxylate transporter substrate binding protein [Variovorax defluvii]|uniref:Tripartite tricarboxylate transporter substrate binding protein n=2 Tax=Variovorax defluvii TaxID=913761 RepID=A0ABP8IHV0_9BURK